MSAEKSISEVYEDRNVLALAFANLAHHSGYAVYHYVHDEWSVLAVELAYGQVSWHMRPEDVPEEFEVFEPVAFDGHTREEKNERLLECARTFE